MELFITLFFLVIGANVALWFFSAGKSQVPDTNEHGLPMSRKVCNAAKHSAKNAKRDRRRRKKKIITAETESQDLTQHLDCLIKTGKTAKTSQKPSPKSFDARVMIVDTSSASKLAKRSLIAVATERPSRIEATGNSTERPCSLLSDTCEENREVSNPIKSEPILVPGENDGGTTTLRYIARSDIPRTTGKRGRMTQFLEKRYGVKIDVPQGVNGNIVISGGNETTRLAVEANIRDRLIMSVTLPSVDAQVRVVIHKLADQGKLKLLKKSFESYQGSVTITGLARDCKVVLDVTKFH
jgi:hypothetical protein